MVSILSDNTPQGHPEQKVLGLLVVPLEGGGEATAEEACVETHVGLLRGLPDQVGILDVGRISTLCISVLRVAEGILAIVTEIEVGLPQHGTDVIVTILSPTGTQFQERQPTL